MKVNMEEYGKVMMQLGKWPRPKRDMAVRTLQSQAEVEDQARFDKIEKQPLLPGGTEVTPCPPPILPHQPSC